MGDARQTQVRDTAGLAVYPDLPQKDWAGNPSHANGDQVVHNGSIYQANPVDKFWNWQ
ncbi:hypothetical protein O9992_29940 [Vibrio lentus]|nr:hypothetical protein [Vibrio lentus]